MAIHLLFFMVRKARHEVAAVGMVGYVLFHGSRICVVGPLEYKGNELRDEDFMNAIPQDLDWVSERAKCSPSTVFRALESQVKTDTERRKSLRNANEMQYGVGFSIRTGDHAFQVTVHRMSEVMGTAIFEKTAIGMDVRYKNGCTLVGVLTLGNDGRCRLRIGESELEFWQFRKMALEPLFFTLLGELRESA